MRTHLDQCRDGGKDVAVQPQRVVIGSDAENPMLLTACEWLDVLVDQQAQVRCGDRKKGIWHLEVAMPGVYTIERRRWHWEAGIWLNAGLPPTKVINGTYMAGKALPIAQAKLRIGAFESTGEPTKEGQDAVFKTELKKGSVELQAWIQDGSGKSICGTYCVYVEHLAQSRISNADSST